MKCIAKGINGCYPNAEKLLLGVQYKMSKGHEHEIVRALEIHTKAILGKSDIGFCVVMGLPMYVKKYGTVLSAFGYFITILFM